MGGNMQQKLLLSNSLRGCERNNGFNYNTDSKRIGGIGVREIRISTIVLRVLVICVLFATMEVIDGAKTILQPSTHKQALPNNNDEHEDMLLRRNLREKNNNSGKDNESYDGSSSSMSEVTLCYSEEAVGLTLTGSNDALTGGVVSTLNIVKIDEEDGQDIYAKLVASTYTILGSQILDEDCYYGYLLSNTTSFLDVAVTLKPIFASSSYSNSRLDYSNNLTPFPASRIALRFDNKATLSYYNFPPTSNTNELSEVGQSVGEFYFKNVPMGEYLLQYEFQFDAEVFDVCTKTQGTENSGPATSTIVLGPHVLSYQKITLMGAGASTGWNGEGKKYGMMNEQYHDKQHEEPYKQAASAKESYVCLEEALPTIRRERKLRSGGHFEKSNEFQVYDDIITATNVAGNYEGHHNRKGGKNLHNQLHRKAKGKNIGGSGKGSSGKKNDDNEKIPMVHQDHIAMCFQNNETLVSSFVDTLNDQDEDSISFTINFGTIDANEGDDFYAHVLGSTFSFLQQFIFEACDVSQLNMADAFVSVQVQMEQVSTGFFVQANPSTEAVLRFDMIDQRIIDGSFDLEAMGELFQTLSPRSGDYYFHNLPEGTYRLSFVVTLETSSLNECQNLNNPNLYYYPSSADIELGDRVFTLERIHIAHQEECRTTVGHNRDRTRRALEKNKDDDNNDDRSVVHLCYQDEFAFEVDSVIATPAGINQPTTRNDNSLIIDFGTVQLSGYEDLHAKLTLSTFTMFLNTIAQFDDLPAECSFLQQSESSIKIVVDVTLRSLDYNSFVMPQPSQSIILNYLGWKQDTVDIEDFGNTQTTPFEYSLQFGLGRGGISTGEFYFINAPSGTYELQFEIQLMTQTSTNCFRRRNLQQIEPNPFGRAMAVLGEHVISLEKIDVLRSGQCQPITTGAVGPLPFFS